MEKKTNLEIVHQTLDEQYYKGEDLISDAEFDVLDDQLVIPLDPIAKEKHLINMGSMPKLRNEQDLERFKKMYGKHRCWLEPKLDGAGIELIYEYSHGVIISCYHLTKAISRGVDEGKTGRNVLPMIKMLRPGIPSVIHIPDTRYGNTLSVRCEYVFNIDTFEKVKSTYNWEHIRGSATGLLLKDELTIAHTLPRLVYYNIKNEHGEDITLSSDLFKLAKVVDIEKTFVKDLTIVNLQDLFEDAKENSIYPVDGIVIRLDDSSLGLHGCYAYKPKYTDIKFTEIESIDWQVSRLGRLNPVANVKPVMFDGSLVSKVTLNNMDYIKGLNLAIGSVVEIQKTGDVIPEIVKNITTDNVETTPIMSPSACPFCGSPTYQENAFVYCSNTKCQERTIKALEYTFKEVFKLKGFGYAYCQSMVKELKLTKPLDLFRVSAEKLLTFATFDSTNKNLTLVLHKYFQQLAIHKIPLKSCYILLNLPSIARTWAEKLASLCPTAHSYIELLKAIRSNSLPEEYGELPTNVLKSFILHQDDILEMFDLLSGYIKQPRICKLTGKRFCITGSGPRPRNDIIELIELNGGTFSNSVSKKTDLLFIGDNPGQTKMSKAIQYQIKTMIITEDIIEQLATETFTI